MQDPYVLSSKSESTLNVGVPEKRNIRRGAEQAIDRQSRGEDVFVLIVKGPVDHGKSIP